MKVGLSTLKELGAMLTGDSGLMPRRSGPILVQFFNKHGFNDHYPEGGGFPTKRIYAFENLQKLNGKDGLRSLINAAFDGREFLTAQIEPKGAVDHFNKFLAFDNYELVYDAGQYKVRETNAGTVKFVPPIAQGARIDYTYIEEQVAKCDRKITEGDFAGAITNARTLLEGVLLHIEEKATGQPVVNDGDLLKLYRRVQKLLNLDPAQQGISEPIKNLLSGLSGVVNGLASMRNKMSDAHAGYKPARHHAKLAVNSAKTLADFLFDSYAFQVGKATKE